MKDEPGFKKEPAGIEPEATSGPLRQPEPQDGKDGARNDSDILSRLSFLQTLIDTIPSPIFYKDSDGRYTGCNRAFEESIGLSRETLVGKTVYDLAPRDLADRYFEMDSALFNAPGVQCYETSVKYADGSIHDVIFKKATYSSGELEAAGLVGVFTDITERRRAEERLRASEERYRTLFEESPYGIFESTPKGEITALNPAGLEMLGLGSAEALAGLRLGPDLYEDPRDRDRFIKEVEKNGFARDFVTHVRRNDGQRLTVSLAASAVRGPGGEILAYRGFIRDITAQKELEEQLIHAQKMDAVGKLTGGIAHDFNNMIMAIIGYTTILQMKIREDDPLSEHVRSIFGVTERAANLTRRLLAFSRKQIMSLKREDLNAIVGKAGGLLGRLIGEHIEFRTSLIDTELSVMADSGQVEQVLMNLATNARDAMPSGGTLTISTAVAELDDEFIATHGYGERGRYACITVHDTGTGMAPETRSRIFDPFFTTKEVGKGTGLGLSIVYGIIKQHNGYITVCTEEGRGTTFTVYLPAAVQKPALGAHRPPERCRGATGMETVLLTEDDAEVRRITKAILEEHGYIVKEAFDGEDALEKFVKDKDLIKLVILDVIMPRKNGWEVYDEIMKIAPGTKAIFFSGYSEETLQRAGAAVKPVDFIPKPVWPSEFLRKVREALNGEHR